MKKHLTRWMAALLAVSLLLAASGCGRPASRPTSAGGIPFADLLDLFLHLSAVLASPLKWVCGFDIYFF